MLVQRAGRTDLTEIVRGGRVERHGYEVGGQKIGPENEGSVLPQLQPALHLAIHG